VVDGYGIRRLNTAPPGVCLPAVNCSYVSRAIITWCRLSPSPSRTTTSNSRGSNRTADRKTELAVRAPLVDGDFGNPFEFSYQRLRLAADR
jgi:hypothetical protein